MIGCANQNKGASSERCVASKIEWFVTGSVVEFFIRRCPTGLDCDSRDLQRNEDTRCANRTWADVVTSKDQDATFRRRHT